MFLMMKRWIFFKSVECIYLFSYCKSVNSHIPHIFTGGLLCARCEDFSGGCNGEKAHTQQVGAVEGVAGMPVQT